MVRVESAFFERVCPPYLMALILLVATLLCCSMAAVADVAEEDVVDYLSKNPDFLIRHPSLLEQAFEFQRAMQAQQGRIERARILTSSAEFLQAFRAPSEKADAAGNERLIVFMDYECIPCRMDHLERANSELSDYFEVIEIPMGTMSSVSAQAVRLLLSLRMSDEISAWSLHQELLETRLPLVHSDLVRIAESHGMSPSEIDSALGSPRSAAALREIRSFASDLGVSTTPTYLVGCELFQGRSSLSRLKEMWTECQSSPPD